MSDLVYEETGEFIHVPNFMINDPVFKKDFVEEKNVQEKKLDVLISRQLYLQQIVLFNCYEQKKEAVKISNLKTGKDLKLLYLQNNKLSPDKYIVRLFNKGFEIKDDHKLSTHTINKDSNVQIVVKEIELEENNKGGDVQFQLSFISIERQLI